MRCVIFLDCARCQQRPKLESSELANTTRSFKRTISGGIPLKAMGADAYPSRSGQNDALVYPSAENHAKLWFGARLNLPRWISFPTRAVERR